MLERSAWREKKVFQKLRGMTQDMTEKQKSCSLSNLMSRDSNMEALEGEVRDGLRIVSKGREEQGHLATSRPSSCRAVAVTQLPPESASRK